MRITLNLYLILLVMIMGTSCYGSPWKLELNTIQNLRAGWELIKPETLFPSIQNIDEISESLLQSEENCIENQNILFNLRGKLAKNELTNQQHIKLTQWVLFHCKILKELPQDFFSKKPYMTLIGDSWVKKAYFSSHPDFANKQWLQSMLLYSHLLEFRELFENTHLNTKNDDDLNQLILELNPQTLKQILNGDVKVFTNKYNLSRISNQWPTIYLVHNSATNNFFQSTIFIQILSLTLALLAIILLWVIRRLMKVKKQFHQDRELMIQTIAHELRHPVTSLQLSLEVFRNSFEQIPSEVQTEFLRMSGQVQRLFRIIHASNQYLISTPKTQKLFELNNIEIESMNDFISDILSDYTNKVTLHLLPHDTSFSVDPYWFSVCLTNLIKNALIHGVPPIEVKLLMDDESFIMRVADHGKIEKNLQELTTPFSKSTSSQGLGLGLTIVFRIIKIMGGTLTLNSNPTQFEIRLKRKLHEKAFAS